MSWEEDHRQIWAEINSTKQEMIRISAKNDVRYEEIVRRQEDSMRDRHGMSLKVDGLLATVNAIEDKLTARIATIQVDLMNAIHSVHTRMLLTALSALGSVILAGIGIAVTLLKK